MKTIHKILLGIQAGLDLFIYSNRQPADSRLPEHFHQVAKAAVESGQVLQTRIKESVRRISRLKQSLS